MKTTFPKLPSYGFSWRSIQIEPIPDSGERITVGTIVKGNDQALIAAKLIPAQKLKSIYGPEFGTRINDALALCVEKAEKYYSAHPLSNKWEPPLEGFYLNELHSSVAEDIENSLTIAAMHSSSFSVSLERARDALGTKNDSSVPKNWRDEIFKAVVLHRADLSNCFSQEVLIRGSGVPLKFGFLSNSYAAQFDALSDIKAIQQALVRVQSKLWQLDRLRDGDSLFKPERCELLLQIPTVPLAQAREELDDFVGELRYEASKRELSVFASSSYDAAAQRILEIAA